MKKVLIDNCGVFLLDNVTKPNLHWLSYFQKVIARHLVTASPIQAPRERGFEELATRTLRAQKPGRWLEQVTANEKIKTLG